MPGAGAPSRSDPEKEHTLSDAPAEAPSPAKPRRRRALVVLAAVALLAPTVPASVYILGSLEKVAVDHFDRVVTEGWGRGEQVAGYTLQGPDSDFEVDGEVATVALRDAGIGRGALLDDFSAVDVDMTFRVATDQRSTGGALFVYTVARGGRDTAYRPKVVIGPEGFVAVHAGVVVGGIESPLGRPTRVTGLRHAPGVFIWVRAQVSGTFPTTLRVRAWRDGRPEPTDWSFTALDVTPELQGSGGVGIHTYLSASASHVPVVVAIDDLTVRARNGPAPSVTGRSPMAETPRPSRATPSPEPTPQTPAPSIEPGVLARDEFDRESSDGWGPADIGGPYEFMGDSVEFAADGEWGVLTLSGAGEAGYAVLPHVQERDVEVSFEVQGGEPGGQARRFAFAIIRLVNVDSSYRPKVELAPDGAVYLHAGRVVDNQEVPMSRAVLVPGLEHVPERAIRVRAQVVGADPTTIQMRAWSADGIEPTNWQLTTIDWAGALQAPGAVGLGGYLGAVSPAVPATMRFDELSIIIAD
jgi:hypothetical protein